MSGFDLNLLVVLDALLAERSVSRAAERLHSTQPSVSRALARLRGWFGEPLFVRSRHGLVPTARAEELHGELRAVLGRLERLKSPRESFDPRRSTRTFRIATTEYAQIVLFTGLLARLEAEAPNVTLQVEPWSTTTLVDALESGRADLALAPVLEDPAQLHTRPLLSDDFVAIVREGHPLAGRPLTRRRFCTARHVQIAPDGREGGVVDDALRALGLERRVVLKVPSFAVAPMIVASSDLLAVVPSRIARGLQEAHSLSILEVPLALPTFMLAAFWHERAGSDPALVWLRAQLVAVGADLPRRPGTRLARLGLHRRARHTL